MRIALAIALLCASAAGLQAQLDSPAPKPVLMFKDSGEFTLKVDRDVYLRGWAGLATSAWKSWFNQADAKFRPAQKRTDGGWDFVGWLGSSEDPLLSYSQTLLFANDALGLAWQFRTLREIDTESINISFSLPAKRFSGKTFRFDQHQVQMPLKLTSPYKAPFKGRPSRVVADMGSLGLLTMRFDGPQIVSIEDRREWNNDDFELRITLNAGHLKKGEIFGLTLQMELPARAELLVGGEGRKFRNETEKWTSFDLPWNDSPTSAGKEQTATDASSLLHSPAGRFGFLQARDGHLSWANGTRQRFWGVCSSWGGAIPAKDEADAVAARMAKFGINMIRSKIDAPSWGDVNIVAGHAETSQQFNKTALDEFDFFFDKLACHGIYSHLDLTWDRVFKTGDGITIDKPDKHGGLYAGGSALFVVDRLAELVEKYADTLLLRKNRYTGKRYVDDPALAIIGIVNENSLFRYPESMPSAYAQALEASWIAKFGPKVPPLSQCAPRSSGTTSDEWTPRATEFLAELETRFYRRVYKHLRSIGVKCPIATSNCAMGMADSWAQASIGDVVEINAYWDHPHKDWKWIRNRSMVRSDGGYLKQIAAASIAGKPLLVTEVNHCGPNEFRAEGPLLLAAHAALQDWDGVLWFNYAGSRNYAKHFNAQSAFDFDVDPARVGQFPAAARIFMSGLVSPARLTTHVAWSKADLLSASPWTWSGWWKMSSGTPPTWLTFISRWRNRLPGIAASSPDIAIAAHRTDAAPEWPPKTYLRIDEKPNSDSAATQKQWVTTANKLKLPIEWEEAVGRAFCSDNGQMIWDQDRGQFSIVAPNSRAAIGFIGGQAQNLGDITFDSISPAFAALTLVPLDGRPVVESKRLLLTTIARCENNKQEWMEGFDGDVAVTHVEPGTVLEPVHAIMTMIRKTPVKVFALDPTGKRKRELSVGRATDGYAITISGESMYYEIVGETGLKNLRLWPFNK